MILRNLFFFLIALSCTNCASLYKSADPRRSVYTNSSEDEGVKFSYRYNVLEETGNKKYSRKESTKGVQVVAVKIKNNSNRELQIGKTLNFYVNDSEASLIPPADIKKELKQSPYIYLLYLGLVPVPLDISFRGRVRGSSNAIPTSYYFIGPGLAATNIFIAANSNKRFLAELKQFDLTGKIIKPGEEVYGLIGLPYNGYDPLYLIRIPE